MVINKLDVQFDPGMADSIDPFNTNYREGSVGERRKAYTVTNNEDTVITLNFSNIPVGIKISPSPVIVQPHQTATFTVLITNDYLRSLEIGKTTKVVGITLRGDAIVEPPPPPPVVDPDPVPEPTYALILNPSSKTMNVDYLLRNGKITVNAAVWEYLEGVPQKIVQNVDFQGTGGSAVVVDRTGTRKADGSVEFNVIPNYDSNLENTPASLWPLPTNIIIGDTKTRSPQMINITLTRTEQPPAATPTYRLLVNPPYGTMTFDPTDKTAQMVVTAQVVEYLEGISQGPAANSDIEIIVGSMVKLLRKSVNQAGFDVFELTPDYSVDPSGKQWPISTHVTIRDKITRLEQPVNISMSYTPEAIYVLNTRTEPSGTMVFDPQSRTSKITITADLQKYLGTELEGTVQNSGIQAAGSPEVIVSSRTVRSDGSVVFEVIPNYALNPATITWPLETYVTLTDAFTDRSRQSKIIMTYTPPVVPPVVPPVIITPPPPPPPTGGGGGGIDTRDDELMNRDGETDSDDRYEIRQE